MGILRAHQDSVTSLEFGPNGKTFLSASCDRSIKIWDSSSGLVLTSLHGHSAEVSGARFLDEVTVISSSFDKTVRIWSLPSFSSCPSVHLIDSTTQIPFSSCNNGRFVRLSMKSSLEVSFSLVKSV